MKDIALLVGNGVNALSKGITWDALLDHIIDFCKDPTLVKDQNKPFPLFYEEIFLRALRSKAIKEEIELKREIASKVSAIEANRVHDLIRELEPAHIMTVNYEFLLEGTHNCKNEGLVKEKLYSIFRKFNIGKTSYWHLHGDCNSAASINLGYEHYSGQLQQMRNYVTGLSNYKNNKLDRLPLINRLKAKGGLKTIQSWIDLFFTKDVHIVGMTLDFVEMDLWWLLTHRTRQMNYRNRVAILNKIYYYIPQVYVAPSKFKLDLLKVNGVEVVEISQPHGLAYYEEVLKQIDSKG